MKIFVRVLVLSIVALHLLSCSIGQDHGDLREYVAAVKAKPAGSIEPLPAFRPFEAFIYGAAGKRSPFDRPIDVKRRKFIQGGVKVTPDFDRPTEYLESFDLASLKMVGNIESKGVLWALLSDADGVVHWVREGNHIGKNHGHHDRKHLNQFIHRSGSQPQFTTGIIIGNSRAFIQEINKFLCILSFSVKGDHQLFHLLS